MKIIAQNYKEYRKNKCSWAQECFHWGQIIGWMRNDKQPDFWPLSSVLIWWQQLALVRLVNIDGAAFGWNFKLQRAIARQTSGVIYAPALGRDTLRAILLTATLNFALEVALKFDEMAVIIVELFFGISLRARLVSVSHGFAAISV